MKKITAFVLVLVMAASLLGLPVLATDYYPRFNGSSESIVDVLNALGAPSSSFDYRTLVAAANGISASEYTGSASQNRMLVELAKQGKLKMPAGSSPEASPLSSGGSSASGSGGWFPKYNGSSESIVDILNALNAPSSSFDYRTLVAAANGISASEYTGSASQNRTLVELAKQGKLKMPAGSSPETSLLSSGSSSVSFEPLNAIRVQEVFGYQDRVYIVKKDGTPLRSEPSGSGNKVRTLRKDDVLFSEGLYQNAKGNRWLKVLDGDGSVCWVYGGNVKEHTTHVFIDLNDYGYPFRFCEVCSKVEQTGGSTKLEISKTDQIHLALAACSLVPEVGNACDITDAVMSLTEGDYVGAGLSFAAALPAIGTAFNAIKAGDTVRTIVKLSERSATSIQLLKDGKYIEIVRDGSRTILRTNMDNLYELTGDIRFKRTPYSAAHHIVEFSDEGAEGARKILEEVGIDINSAANGVYLCTNPKFCYGTIHAGRHVASYSEHVTARLQAVMDGLSNATLAQKKSAVIDELNAIANDLRTAEMELRKFA